MEIKNLSIGQKQALLESLENQTSPKTNAEKSLLLKLREFFAVPCMVEKYGINLVKRCGNFVKQIELDTFGEDYRNCWIKIQENTKGAFFYCSYMGKRIYLD